MGCDFGFDSYFDQQVKDLEGWMDKSAHKTSQPALDDGDQEDMPPLANDSIIFS